MKHIFTLIICLVTASVLGQNINGFNRKQKKIAPEGLFSETNFRLITAENSVLSNNQTLSLPKPFRVVKDSLNQVIFIENNSNVLRSGTTARKSIQIMGNEFLESVKNELRLKSPLQELVAGDTQTDTEGQMHVRFQQNYKGVPVYGGELILHSKGEKIDLLNGRVYPTPQLEDLTPTLNSGQAIEMALNDVSKKTSLQRAKRDDANSLFFGKSVAELIVYHKNQVLANEKLAYKITIHPNLLERWVYFIDAITGEVIEKHNHTCSLDGGKSSTARDLNGITQTLSTYQSGNKYYLIDTGRQMFNGTKSKFPDNPAGAIWTIDGLNSRASSNDPNFDQVASLNNNDWSPTGVSAHYNGGIAYEYYLKTFNRNSLDGKGGTIVSVINIADDDGGGMDNAYWNGQFMAYGNGRSAFRPLAAALDVAGHEMTHGVVEATAKLEYLSQSGAINESMADIFGCMIDRSNWTVGEGVVKPNVFPSGALRSLSNPNQGGKGDPGYQPKTMSQYQYLQETEEQDNGGVHINSGIPNYAFYLFASNAGVGKDKAEQVYYQTLTKYLTRSSKFIDLRLAVIQSVKDKYPNDANMLAVAKSAFDAVGILDPNASSGGTNTTPTPSTSTLPTSSGTDFVLVYDPVSKKLYNGPATTSSSKVVVNENNYKVISSNGLLSKPSVQDDGSNAYYVGLDKNIYQYNFASAKETKIRTEGVWGNATISKDGKRLAALTELGDLYIYLFNLENNSSTKFKLYNPTSSKGVSTGEVQYADSFEWDYSGENVVYDAFNNVTNKTTSLTTTTSNLEYWDVGIMKVWDASKNTFGTGQIRKIFSGLDPGESIGNPSFSKTSPDILSFDYYNSTVSSNSYDIIGVNLATNALVYTLSGNNDIGYPNYTRLDDALLFNSKKSTSQIVNYISLASDKISSSPKNATLGSATIVFPSGDAQWAVWYWQGTRTLPTKTTQTISFDAIPDKKAGEVFSVNAKSSVAALTIQYSVVSGDATVSGNQVTAGATSGKVVIRAFQLGTTQYAAASAEQSFNVIGIAKLDQTITFNAISDKIAGESFSVNAISSANLPIQYTVVTGDASISGSTISLGSKPGKVLIRATQVGNEQYNGSTKEISFCIAPATPTLTANGAILTVSGGSVGVSYQFYYNGQAADKPITATQVQVENAGSWSVKALTADGCYSTSSTSVNVLVTILGINSVSDGFMRAYPNPSAREIRLEFATGTIMKSVHLIHADGREILNTKENFIIIDDLPTGTYYLKAETNNGIFIKKIIKE